MAEKIEKIIFSWSTRILWISTRVSKANSSETEDRFSARTASASYPLHPPPTAFDTVNQQILLIIHADLGISQGLPCTCRATLIRYNWGELSMLHCFHQGPFRPNADPPSCLSLIHTIRHCAELTELLYKAIFNQCWRELAAPAQTAEKLGDICGNRQSLELTFWHGPAGFLFTHPCNRPECQQWLSMVSCSSLNNGMRMVVYPSILLSIIASISCNNTESTKCFWLHVWFPLFN